MTESTSAPVLTPTEVTRTSRGKAVRAVLAGGLVLGIGAAVTLAAWNDSEFVRGVFGAGKFNVQGSVSGTAGTFSDHDTAGAPATLAFTLPLSTNLAPSSVVYAPYFVQLTNDTTTNAALSVTSLASSEKAGAPANAANLSYSVYGIAPAATCNAATVGSLTAIASGTTLTSAATLTGTTPVSLAKSTDGTAPGATQQLCFVVTAGAGLAQAGETTATWQLTAVSQ
ncbi:hypothetical protein D9V32_05980 [Mycetocola tolaasinivorans]|uniref:SipW-cognate class signal peptide n=1 Tax=Mycetocola tolaasinivorans TaxID=76635 RepID=A0A3L7A8N0_9MICO|nr:SipW-dependent-type signal peptide-containing protein [Mycetocola tolaasinivorans]RLP76414.1 hypothetical protein D9V32_05980 [Mycetocola tolaasinivorans]